MNWTPDNNYNGNETGWTDGNPNGYRVDDAVLANHPVSPQRLLRRPFRALLVILILAGIVALFIQVLYFSPPAAPIVSHPKTPTITPQHHFRHGKETR